MKIIKCQYPKCKKNATHSLGLNDPDSEPNYYCKDHCELAKMNTIMAKCKIKQKED